MYLEYYNVVAIVLVSFVPFCKIHSVVEKHLIEKVVG